MADIFISHSGQDSETAAAIYERIGRERPTWSLFYDKDHIRGGQRWQERLREELTSCRVVLAVLSRNWLSSPWCFTEAVTATFRGKDVIGIETEDLTSEELARAPPILHERQRVRLRKGDNRAWQEVLETLDRSGLDPDDWFPRGDVGPYPGLVAFDEKNAGVFFGRKQEITDTLAILDTLRGPDRSQVLVISGGSGCGKSSLLRAGLIPRLRRKKHDWVVINSFEVAREPVRNLLDQISEALARFNIPREDLDLTSVPGHAGTLAQLLGSALQRLEQASGAWVLLPLDQAEALVASDRQASDAPKLLLEALVQLLRERTRHVVVAATIRTEFVPRLEAVFAGTEVRLRQAPLSAIGSLAEIIEKPAERFGIELEPGLTERIIEDVRAADALPLLAYTLKALEDREGADFRLTLDGYRALGGVRGAIGAALELVLRDPEPTEEEVRALRRTFTRHLIRVDAGAVEGERMLRRVADRARLPPAADRVLSRLIDARLLITGNGTIELAHERVINDWPKLPLKTWLTQDAADRGLIDQLRQRVADDALPDGLLAQAEELLQRDPELAAEEPAVMRLVQMSRDRKRELERERRKRLVQISVTALALFVLTVFAIIGMVLSLKYADKAKVAGNQVRAQLLTLQAGRAVPSDPGLAAALALESIEIARKIREPRTADAVEIARTALIQLPLGMISQGSPVLSMAVLTDGRLASGGQNGEIKIWPRDGKGNQTVLSQGGSVSALAVLADGRLASGDQDGKIKIWATDGAAKPEEHSQGSPVEALVALKDGRLASGGEDGIIKIWPKEGADRPVLFSNGAQILSLAALRDGRLASGGADGNIRLWSQEPGSTTSIEPLASLSQGAPVSSLAVLKDGRLASGDADGNIKIWPSDLRGATAQLPQMVLRHGDASVRFLAVLEDGRMVSGGEDGKIKVWPKGSSGEQAFIPQVVLSHGGRVFSLAVLADGVLASGGADGKIKLWPRDGTGEPLMLPQESGVESLIALEGGQLASGGADGSVKIWPSDGMGKPRVLLHGGKILSLTVLADGRLASGGTDSKIKIWPLQGTDPPVVIAQSSGVSALVALPDGRLASGGGDERIRIWLRKDTGAPGFELQSVLRQGSPVAALIVAGGRLISGADDGSINVWPKSLAGDPEVHLRAQHGAWVSSLAVLRDGRLASGDIDGIKFWRTDGLGKQPIEARDIGRVLSLTVLRDGRLVSGAEDGTINIWPKEGRGEPVVLQHGSKVLSLVEMTDGRLASGGEDGTIRIWIVNEKRLIADLCLRAGRNLTEQEWKNYIGSDKGWQPSCRSLKSNWQMPSP